MNSAKIGNGLGILFMIVIGWLLVQRLGDLEWAKVMQNLKSVPLVVLMGGICLTGLSYTIFSSYDYLNIKTEGRSDLKAVFMVPTFLSYVMNFNLGSLVGAVGMRLKLYHDLGMKPKKVTKLLALSTYGHWLGFMLLAGLIFTFFPKVLRKVDFFSDVALPWLGGGILLLLFVVLLGANLMKNRKFSKYEIVLPPLKWHFKRMALSSLNWLLVTGVFLMIFSVYYDVPWYMVSAAYFIAAIGGVVAHVPAGIGVFEYIFVLFLSGYIANEDIVSGMILYRVLYFVIPLIVSGPVFIWFYTSFLKHFKSKGEVLNEVVIG